MSSFMRKSFETGSKLKSNFRTQGQENFSSVGQIFSFCGNVVVFSRFKNIVLDKKYVVW